MRSIQDYAAGTDSLRRLQMDTEIAGLVQSLFWVAKKNFEQTPKAHQMQAVQGLFCLAQTQSELLLYNFSSYTFTRIAPPLF